MGYVAELRSLVGQRPLILVGAEVLIFDSNNCLLLTRPADNGLWEIPIGMMEPGESLEDTARREALEECGCRPLRTGDRLVSRRAPFADPACHAGHLLEARVE